MTARTVLAFALLLSPVGRAAGTPILTAAPGEFNSSEQCGACHRDIHAAWKQSAHAQALEDPLFLDALRALDAEGKDAKVCLACHAPTVATSRDARLEKKLTWEGVTCDYCHSAAAVSAAAVPKLTLSVGSTKFGPIEDAVSQAHKTAFKPHFRTSELCASCHEYSSPTGVPILTTYSEWKTSPQAAEGKTCQACHMSEVKAHVVDPRVQRLTAATVNLHTMPGSHSVEMLNQAVLIRARPVRRGNKIEVEVEVINRGAGHAVPTGSAARQMLLEVRVDTNTQKQQQEQVRVYERVLVDQAGVPLFRDRDLFLRAAKLKSDSRLKPGEIRKENFAFDVGSGALANIKLRLLYRHTPEPGREPAVSQVFYTQSWTLPPG